MFQQFLGYCLAIFVRKLNVKDLITHSFSFENASDAYELLTTDKSALGILLRYNSETEKRHISSVSLNSELEFIPSEPVVGFVGAGNYASRVLIPAFKKAGAQLHTISTSGGINGVIHGNQSGFKEATTDTYSLIENQEINTVAIVTQHSSHSYFVNKALNASKNVFVEKPLAINQDELEEVKQAYEVASSSANPPKLMVGFNRRFAPQIQKIKTLIEPIKAPKSFIMTMNAGSIPADHWTQDINVGGGRIIGEACHFIDLMRFLAGSEIISVQARRMGDRDGVDITEDKAAIILGFADGSFGTIHYYANGAASFPKERIEVFADGRVLQLDNFVKLKGYGFKGFKKMNLWKQDKGQNECSRLFLESIKYGTPSPIPIDEIFEVAKVSIDVAEQLRNQ